MSDDVTTSKHGPLSKQVYTDEELVYAAGARCSCGAGFAYPRHTFDADGNMTRLASAWECSDILTRRALPASHPDAASHNEPLPFSFYDVKSEQQHIHGGPMTTRPGGLEELDRAEALWKEQLERADRAKADRLGRVAWEASLGPRGADGRTDLFPKWEELSDADREVYRVIAAAVKAAVAK